jgi:HK97 gp10 family phage protein
MASKAMLQLKGFDDLLEKIQKAGGSIDAAADSCLRQSAQIMQAELKAQMQAAGVDDGLINAMPPPQITVNGNRYSAAVGYKKGDFDPNDPSDGYKVVFLNYGTPRRTMHGKVKARGFIEKAKKKARPQIKKAQQQTLEKILVRVNK